MKDFRKIVFGCTDAQTEGMDYPELLRDGYIDTANIVDKALNKSTFLFLGYKGSGKSSLSEHLRLIADDNIIIDQQELKKFPFSTFYKIIPTNSEPEVRAQQAWHWVLLVKVLMNFLNDEDAKSNNSSDVDKAIELFTQAGLLPLTDITTLVKKTSTNIFKASIKSFEYTRTQTSENVDVSISLAASFIENLLKTFKGSHQHYIIIDDLDDVLSTKEQQYITITALIKEIKDLNRFFRTNNVPVKLIVLCRSDIFDRLPDPNKNKIKQDSSYTFTWYREGVNTERDSELVHLVNTRAKMACKEITDIFEDFFPPMYKKQNIHTALLDLTRHTPRDFIQLLNSIQEMCTGPKVNIDNIERGIKVYSQEYFQSEIRDELAGYVGFDTVDYIYSMFTSLRKRDFTYAELEQKYKQIPELKKVELKEVLRILYDCSAIGHIYRHDQESKPNRFTFKYRNRNTMFNPDDRILLHKGLWKAFNVNY